MTNQSEVVLQDGGEQTIKCSDCNTPLMHYRPYAKVNSIENTIVATCPFCNGQSFEHKILGLSWTGPIGTDENFKATVIEDIVQLDNNKWKFQIKAR